MSSSSCSFLFKHANTYIQSLSPKCIQLLCHGGYPKESGVFAKQVNNNTNQLCLQCTAAPLRAPETEPQLSKGFICIHIYSNLEVKPVCLLSHLTDPIRCFSAVRWFSLRSALQKHGLGLVLKGTVNSVSLSIETLSREPKSSTTHKEVGWGSGHRH